LLPPLPSHFTGFKTDRVLICFLIYQGRSLFYYPRGFLVPKGKSFFLFSEVEKRKTHTGTPPRNGLFFPLYALSAWSIRGSS